MLEQFYDESCDSYTIPAKFLSKNILKGIEDRMDHLAKKKRRQTS